jgi:hypothetical protein
MLRAAIDVPFVYLACRSGSGGNNDDTPGGCTTSLTNAFSL